RIIFVIHLPFAVLEGNQEIGFVDHAGHRIGLHPVYMLVFFEVIHGHVLVGLWYRIRKVFQKLTARREPYSDNLIAYHLDFNSGAAVAEIVVVIFLMISRNRAEVVLYNLR